MTFTIEAVRARFPALSQTDDGRARVYLDAPGGTQVCGPAIERMTRYLEGGTANAGGAFRTSRETDALAHAAHEAVADLIGGDAGEIAFGPNMTTLTLAVSRALARDWWPGDEIVLSALDHDANVAPWLAVAADRGMMVRWLEMDPHSGTLRLDMLPALLSDRTRLVAVGGASNALGTVNDIAAIVRTVRAHSSALVFVDAVQSVPHLPTDVCALGCDLLVFSPYKMFGPHQGVLWGRAGLLDRVEAYKVRPATTTPPAARFETGTPSFEAMAATLGMIEYLAWLGAMLAPAAQTRTARLQAALAGAGAYEHDLGTRMLNALGSIAGLRLYGPPAMANRVPTFAFTIAGHSPRDIVAALAEDAIYAWSGHFYAVEPVRRLGLIDTGGLVRIGLCHYNTVEEVDRLQNALAKLT